MSKSPDIAKLLEIMAALRTPGTGCPWDLEQDFHTIAPYTIEEAYEVADAIARNDLADLKDELGDLLLQVVFHARIAEEREAFDFAAVVDAIIAKMLRRHPHVFGEGKAETADDVILSWDKIKKEEKAEKKEVREFFNDPKGLPALMLADSTQRSAAKIGFDWSDLEGPYRKVQEELSELQESLQTGVGIREELGDLLFAVVNVARFLKLDAEEVLREAVHKFQARFLKTSELSREAEQNFEQLSLEEMDLFWDRAKSQEKQGKFI